MEGATVILRWGMDKMDKEKLERRRIVATDAVRLHCASERAEDQTNELPQIVGYTAVYRAETEIFSWYGSFKEEIERGAFTRAIKEKQDVRALRNHDPDNLLGRTASGTLRLKEDERGLFIEVDTPNTSLGRDTVELISRGDLSGMSFAFVIRKERWERDEEGFPSKRIIEDVDLYDVGPVTYPAYSQTTADVRSASMAHRAGFLALGIEVPDLPEPGEEPNFQRKRSKTKEEEVEKPSEPEIVALAVGVYVPSYRARVQLLRQEREQAIFEKRLLTE